MAKRSAKKPDIEQPLGIVYWEDSAVQPPYFYANHAQVMPGPWDFALRFGQLSFGAGERFEAQELMRVFVSPQTCKALARLLARQVEVYERMFGEIADIEERLANPVSTSPAQPSEPTPDVPPESS